MPGSMASFGARGGLLRGRNGFLCATVDAAFRGHPYQPLLYRRVLHGDTAADAKHQQRCF
jgi:hypothetical protein